MLNMKQKFKFQSSYPNMALAIQAAKAMRAMLDKPKGWKLRVHCSEPLKIHRKHGQWYASLQNGQMTLNTSVSFTEIKFWTLLNSRMDGSPCGDSRWSDLFQSKNPNKAIAHQVKLAMAVIGEIKRVEKLLNSLI